jgi:formylmethanofuran dehydrogenase subunit C
MGMRGGLIVIKGGAGARAGDRMRRGLILIEGLAGRYLGSRMIAGTVIAMGGAGAYPGYMMRRGTVIVDGAAPEMAPSFTDCGKQELTFCGSSASWRAGRTASHAPAIAPVRRYAGDMAVLGKGECCAWARKRGRLCSTCPNGISPAHENVKSACR